MQIEQWRAIDGWEGYEVSNHGRVRCFKPRGYNRPRLSIPHVKTTHLSVWGYPEVRLHSGDKTRKFRVHRLVAEAFIPNPHLLPEVNHKDGNKQNNCVGNLEWITRSQNMSHAYEKGLASRMRGERNGHVKLTRQDIVSIKRKWSTGKHLQKDLAHQYGVARTTISAVVNNYNWTHIT